MRSSIGRRDIIGPHQFRIRRIGDIPGAQRPGAAEGNVKPVVRLVDDRMVRVLSLETWGAVFLAGQDGPADKFRMFRILEISDVQDDRTETRLAGTRIEEARLLGPVTLVGPNDEFAAAAGSAVVGRRTGDLRH